MADTKTETGRNAATPTKAAGSTSATKPSKAAPRKRANTTNPGSRTSTSTAASQTKKSASRTSAAKGSGKAAPRKSSPQPTYGVATALTGIAGLLVGGLAIWFGRQQIEAATGDLIEQAKTQYAKRKNGSDQNRLSAGRPVVQPFDEQRFD